MLRRLYSPQAPPTKLVASNTSSAPNSQATQVTYRTPHRGAQKNTA